MIRALTAGLLLTMAGAAQNRPAWDEGYNAAQAERGRAGYRDSCARCHGPELGGGESTPALAGASFLSSWSGKSAAELLERTRRTMPTDNPGGLTGRQYADITAYVLAVNGFRAGTRELGGSTLPVAATGGNSEWRYLGGDAAHTKYSPLEQINAGNASKLHVAWSWKAQNFGKQPEFNWEVTPLMVGGRLFLTAGTRRDALALDAATGETLWMYRLDEGKRGDSVARRNNRGLAYWSKGSEERILLISPGYQLIALDARTGRPMPGFGKEGVVDLWEGLDREVKPGEIGASSPAIVVGDVVVVGAALQAGIAPRSKQNVPGYIRGYDVHSGKRLWTFHTIAQPGEFGHETWENESWKYTGNTGAWGPLSADLELGYVYVPVETPTGDFYGGHRHGDNLFGESLVCLDAKTGRRVWHFQMVHHGVWDWDPPTSPTLLDITVQGRRIKAVAQITKQGWVYVFDRVTGKPVWPIEERAVPQTDVPGERTSATQPFPSKPAAFDKQGFTEDDLIDFTPELKAEALKIAAQYRLGPMFMPPSVAGAGGRKGTITLPSPTGGANWQGGAADPETGILYVSSVTFAVPVALAPDRARTDMDYLGHYAATNIGPRGLPLAKPPWGRITAIDLNTGEHVWMTPNGSTPENVKSNPALKGIDLGRTGNPEHAPLLVTKSLLFTADGGGMYAMPPGAGGPMFRALDKRTGKIVHEMKLPANVTGVPMTYLLNGIQYLVMPVGAPGMAAELIALTVQ